VAKGSGEKVMEVEGLWLPLATLRDPPPEPWLTRRGLACGVNLWSQSAMGSPPPCPTTKDRAVLDFCLRHLSQATTEVGGNRKRPRASEQRGSEGWFLSGKG
jgi:hypothetical protein